MTDRIEELRAAGMNIGDRVTWDVYLRHGFISRYEGVIDSFVDLDDMGQFAFLRATGMRCFHPQYPDRGRSLPAPTEMQAECVSKLRKL